LTCIVIIYYLH